MPEHIRALIYILSFSTVILIAAQPVVSNVMARADFRRRSAAWIMLTVIIFLAHNFWLYVAGAAVVLLYVQSRDSNPIGIFFFLLFALPGFGEYIPGIGGINKFIEINAIRLLELCVLLPAFIVLIRKPDVLPFGRILPDVLLLIFLAYTTVLQLRETTVTDTIRYAVAMFLDVFLPYYVASRALTTMSAFRDALAGFVVASLLLAAAATFETLRHWLLYISLPKILGAYVGSAPFFYLERAGELRAIVTIGQAIALGYALMVGIGFFYFVRHYIDRPLVRYGALALLALGLLASISRGPWVGMVIFFFLFAVTGLRPLEKLIDFGFAFIFVGLLIVILPGSEKILNLLPFVGTIASETVEYRSQLIEVAITLIERYPWFGSVDYLSSPEMEDMRSGRGIIDIVNSYLQIVLEYGLIGLGIFVGFFATVVIRVAKARQQALLIDKEHTVLGAVLLSMLITILVVIYTVSSILIIPTIYWSVAGLGVAYYLVVQQASIKRQLK